MYNIFRRGWDYLRFRINEFFVNILFYMKKGKYIEHVYGPEFIDYAKDELLVTCLVRNGEMYVKSFIEHYFSLGVKHIVFLDNGSSDKTVELVSKYKNVTIFETKLSYKKYRFAFKRFLVNRFAKNKWVLYVDIDEFFDYPYSDKMNLSSLLKYLNENSYTAVLGQMLDMFSDKPLAKVISEPTDDIKKKYAYYDISEIEKVDLRIFGLKKHFGGINKSIFGIGDIKLSKFPLFFMDHKIKPFRLSSHDIKNGRIADFSVVLNHYKFLGSFYDKVIRVVKEGQYHKGSLHYKIYLSVLKDNYDFNILQKTSNKLNSVNDLVKNDFLIVSENYLSWIKSFDKL